MAEPGHAIAFYGQKGSVRVGLMVEQSTEACKLISSIPIWMGYAAKIKARVISLQEANDMIVGLKRLNKEDLKKALMELHHRLSSWRLRNTGSNLSAMAQPFVLLATSSNTAVRPLGVVNAPAPMPLPPPADPVTHPLYTSEDEGATTEEVTPKKKIAREVAEKPGGNEGLRLRPVTVVQKPLVLVAPLEFLTPQWDGDTIKRRGELITKSTSWSLMVKPASLRGWVRPSIDGLKASPIIGTIMRTNTSWLRSLEL